MHAGEVIRVLRKKRKLTQEELAEMLEVKKSSVQKYESGKVQNLKLEKIRKLCQIFEITPIAFIYPETWEEVHLPNENNNDFFERAKVYFDLTDEGKRKVLDYIEDLGQIEQYKRKDMISYQMYKMKPNEDKRS